jgi:hypothetical protein
MTPPRHLEVTALQRGHLASNLRQINTTKQNCRLDIVPPSTLHQQQSFRKQEIRLKSEWETSNSCITVIFEEKTAKRGAMATEQSTGAGTADSPSSPRPQRGDGQRGRGRGRGRSDGNRGRGGAGGMAANEGRQSSGAGRRGGRGGGANVLSAGDLGARFAGQKSGDVRVENGDKKVEVAKSGEKEGDEVEAEVCWICASPIVHESIAPCNHRTCHICCLRMRALYKDKNCAHCRVSLLSKPPYFCIILTLDVDRHRHRMSYSATTLRNGMRTSWTRILRARMRISGYDMRAMISGKTRYYC